MRLFASPLSASGFITATRCRFCPWLLRKRWFVMPVPRSRHADDAERAPRHCDHDSRGAALYRIGLLCGSVFNDKQVGGICGALLTNVSAWLSGTWFDLNLVGGCLRRLPTRCLCARGGSRARGCGGGLRRDYAAPLVGHRVRGCRVRAGGDRFRKKMHRDNI